MGFYSFFCMGKQTKVVDGFVAAKQQQQQQQQQQQHPKVVAAEEQTFSDMYEKTGKVLGKGGYSIVQEAKSRGNSNNLYAVKVIDKENLKQHHIVNLRQEIQILKSMNHPNIVTLHDVFDEDKYCYLIIEKMNGGELFDRIMKKTKYNEKDARDVSRVLLEAINYCHERKVAHRDLKPENLLLTSTENDLDIKIADFGFAKVANNDHSLLTRCGTPTYVCPEILKGVPYGTKADMWSLGVIIYMILAGYPPFISQNRNIGRTNSMSDMYRMIRRGEYEFLEKDWCMVSDDAKVLIRKMLTVDPKMRISASEALASSSWMIQNDNNDDDLESHDLGDNLKTFKKYNAKRKLRQAVYAILATNRIMWKKEEFINLFNTTEWVDFD